MTVPCGQCVGCRLERSRQWAVRCYHEASLYEDNCFITLTYSDDALPVGGSLVLADYQKFMKRLRKKFGSNIRFYHCGEYGETTWRPHYHACLFNFDFADKRKFSKTNNGYLYTSETLNELWPFGHSLIGDVTFESAAYVARYIMKKITGDGAEEHYQSVCNETGEIFNLRPEYTTMSRRPGIGAGWFDKYKEDVYFGDYVVVRGVKMRPPKFYDRSFEIASPNRFRLLRGRRVMDARGHADNNTPARLKVREEVAKARLKMLPRKLEGERYDT